MEIKPIKEWKPQTAEEIMFTVISGMDKNNQLSEQEKKEMVNKENASNS